MNSHTHAHARAHTHAHTHTHLSVLLATAGVWRVWCDLLITCLAAYTASGLKSSARACVCLRACVSSSSSGGGGRVILLIDCKHKEALAVDRRKSEFISPPQHVSEHVLVRGWWWLRKTCWNRPEITRSVWQPLGCFRAVTSSERRSWSVKLIDLRP